MGGAIVTLAYTRPPLIGGSAPAMRIPRRRLLALVNETARVRGPFFVGSANLEEGYCAWTSSAYRPPGMAISSSWVPGSAMGAVLHHHDAVRLADGGQAVGDDKGGAPGQQPVQRLLDENLGVGVDGAGGLVRIQDGRIGQQRRAKEISCF